MKKRGILVLIVLSCLTAIVFLGTGKKKEEKEWKEFTAFFSVPGDKINEENDIKGKIAELTGAVCDENWLGGQTMEAAINAYIASGEYPDFISGVSALYEAGALVPIDEYWDAYPNIRNYMEDYEWERFRLDDGHIYWIPQFGIGNGDTEEVVHEGEAFWIQTRVLKWAGYPKIETLEAYFDVIARYLEANPVMENGTPNIPYTILCDDWRFFCLENPPQFLDGYPNDGSCIVDPETKTVLDYNTTPTAKRYFQILNSAYKDGLVDPESFTQTYEEYLEKLSSGAVLGMVDQWWQFAYEVIPAIGRQDLEEEGCYYVPLPITIEPGIKNQWHVRRDNEVDMSSGISVTVSCQDIEGAFQFINDLLDPEVQKLRYWGVEGIDYQVDEKGLFYRTEEQRKRSADANLGKAHFCVYSYFPRKEGMCADGINAFTPEYQPSEFSASLDRDVKACLEAYGCTNYVDMLGSNEQPGSWYPMYSYSDLLTTATEAGRVKEQMDETKHIWLPQVVMSEDFESTWNQYIEAYKACNPELFFADMQRQLEGRLAEKQ